MVYPCQQKHKKEIPRRGDLSVILVAVDNVHVEQRDLCLVAEIAKPVEFGQRLALDRPDVIGNESGAKIEALTHDDAVLVQREMIADGFGDRKSDGDHDHFALGANLIADEVTMTHAVKWENCLNCVNVAGNMFCCHDVMPSIERLAIEGHEKHKQYIYMTCDVHTKS